MILFRKKQKNIGGTSWQQIILLSAKMIQQSPANSAYTKLCRDNPGIIYPSHGFANHARDILSLAWFAKPCNKGTFVNFTWAIDYCATWSTVGELVPGVVYEAGQTISVDPSNTAKNSTGFTIENEGYIFEESTKKANKGDIGIYCSDIIPNREASIGVGMGSKTAFATSALTSMNFIFTPDIKYWIIFGKFEEGEVMNMTQTTDAVEIVYDPNVYTLSATLGKDNKIKIGR